MWRNCIYLTCFDIQNNSFLFEYSFSSSTLSIASLLLLPSQEQHSCLSIIFLAANALPTDRKPPWELNKAFVWTIFFNPLFLGFPLLSTGLSMFLKETYRLREGFKKKKNYKLGLLAQPPLTPTYLPNLGPLNRSIFYRLKMINIVWIMKWLKDIRLTSWTTHN